MKYIKQKNMEWILLLFSTCILLPLLSIACVVGYGCMVWISQSIWGLPGS